MVLFQGKKPFYHCKSEKIQIETILIDFIGVTGIIYSIIETIFYGFLQRKMEKL